MRRAGFPPHGTLPSQALLDLLDQGVIVASSLDLDQVQPASFDLTLGTQAWSMPGSILPLPGEDVQTLLKNFGRRCLDLSRPETLVRGQVYVVRLREAVRLPPDLAAYANGKSSIGRIDVQTRVLSDGNPRYDKLAPGYHGPLYLEIIPKSFDIRVRAGDSLNQAIFYRNRVLLEGTELKTLHESHPLLYDASGTVLDGADPRNSLSLPGGFLLTLDLDQPVAGWVAKKSFRPLDLARLGAHDPSDYFEPIHRPKDAALFLSREAFYIFSTAERVAVPPQCAVEMLPYDTSAGEFRAHYAGFFDPGFGWGSDGEMCGTPAVLEVRPYEDDLIVRHRQPVCKMAFERLTAPAHRLYGSGESHYAEQRGPRLSKYFKEPSC